MCPFTNPEAKKKYQKEYNEKVRLKKLAEKQCQASTPQTAKLSNATTIEIKKEEPISTVPVMPEPAVAVETPSVMPQTKEPTKYELAKPVFPALTFKPEIVKVAVAPAEKIVVAKKPYVFSLYTYSLPEILFAREPHLIRLEPLAENIVVANRLVEKKPYTFGLFSYSLAEILFAREPHLIRSF